MNTALFDEAAGADTAAQFKHRAPTPPEDRGRLTVEDRVVEKVAGYAVTLVADAVAAPRRILGVRVRGARPDDTASVRAQVRGDLASMHVAIAVRWPKPVPEVADEVRNRIRSEVRAITGVHVDHVDVEVVSLRLPEPAEPRVR